MNLTVYSILHLPSCCRFFISNNCRYQILWTFRGGILFDLSNCTGYVLKCGCCYSTTSLLLPKSCLRLSYSLVVDCFNFLTSNKQRLWKNLPVISSTKHDFEKFDILSSHSWRTVFLSFNFAAWLSDMVRNV